MKKEFLFIKWCGLLNVNFIALSSGDKTQCTRRPKEQLKIIIEL